MPRIMVDQVHPVHVVPEAGHSQVVKNLGKVNVYYKDTTFVPNTKNELEPTEGTELAEGSEVTIEKFSGLWFLAGVEAGEAPKTKAEAIIELKAPTALVLIGENEIAAEAVTASKIGAEAVTTAKIKKESISAAKDVPPTVPEISVASKNLITMGVAGTERIIYAGWSTEKAKAKIKIKHTLSSEFVTVVGVWTLEKTKKAVKQLPLTIIKEVNYKSATEIEIELETEPTAEKEEYIFVLVG